MHANTTTSTTLASGISEVQVSTFVMGALFFVCIVAVTLASFAYRKAKRQRKIAAHAHRRLQHSLHELDQMAHKLSAAQQDRMEHAMKEAQYAPLRPYAIPRDHVKFGERIGQGVSVEVWFV